MNEFNIICVEQKYGRPVFRNSTGTMTIYQKSNLYSLRSYDTLVAQAVIHPSIQYKGIIMCYGTFSATTIRHISTFAKWLFKNFRLPVTYFDFKQTFQEHNIMFINC